MGHCAESTVIYVGLARLPQPLVTAAPSVAVEIEVELPSRCIVAVNTNLQFPCLERLLRKVLVGSRIDNLVGGSMLEIEVRYSAPFSAALTVALQAALRRAMADATVMTPPADRANGRAIQALNGNGANGHAVASHA